MQRITVRVSGTARGKGRTRPRFGGGPKGFVKPKADRIAEAVVIDAWKDAGEPRIEDDVAIRILVGVSVPRPKSHFKTNGELSKLGLRHPVPRNKKPDVDNVAKLVMDCMNKRAYRDDVAVAELAIVRRWADWDETLMVIETIHDPVE